MEDYNYLGRTTVRSPATAIRRGLEPLDVTINSDVKQDEFEAQSDVNYELQTVEVQLEGRITGKRVTV
ncbi:hypothetical protein A2U01_0052460 [Trifolium medium]|uniref:Uncharacterized protein n=1 Tax=Trifolium medium TaxID=97028 RepID=A0A392R3R5_9FABA|nr:hypothetical protein [Trifolium medium]